MGHRRGHQRQGYCPIRLTCVDSALPEESEAVLRRVLQTAFRSREPAFKSRTHCRRGASALVAVALTLLSLAGLRSALAGESGPRDRRGASSPQRYLQGQYLYARHCVTCHGEAGDGRGELAAGMFPKPRPFKDGVFKYRSTPPGTLPTDEDLARTIAGGLVGTSMPTFSQFSQAEILALVEYVKGFSRRWMNKANLGTPVRVPKLPAWFSDRDQFEQQQGRGALLAKTACVPCHGEKNDGKGESAANLLDDWGERSVPTDLRQNLTRVGSKPEDLYRLLLTGIGGTPMPSYAETLKDDERWGLVAWLLRLRGQQ